ncbi:hypothetical protein UPYG_G00024460 [Umbra pygmaea]|uniref:Uncharacterized protein n=1 Tax=Umbra pygmaea TaxID=75934 RepID=A0ABD0XLI0_UMBPY
MDLTCVTSPIGLLTSDLSHRICRYGRRHLGCGCDDFRREGGVREEPLGDIWVVSDYDQTVTLAESWQRCLHSTLNTLTGNLGATAAES